MNFFFRNRPKPPAELAVILKNASLALAPTGPKAAASGKAKEKAARDAAKSLLQLKALFNGTTTNQTYDIVLISIIFAEVEPSTELIAELAQEAYYIGLLEIMCSTLQYYDFESRKAVAIVFNGLLKRPIGNRLPTVDYISQHPEILFILLKG